MLLVARPAILLKVIVVTTTSGLLFLKFALYICSVHLLPHYDDVSEQLFVLTLAGFKSGKGNPLRHRSGTGFHQHTNSASSCP
ncbi:hypothetical protein F2Q69_00055947 [Brassica cretica]|uniref:Uncharacterized protein n=1 Tax=Brassica cretica TaxID=69181 RepID=A0A8S9N2M8_BRACR|nr:hypothetical protein F2Q69_00055947 [Brassica cretica]